MQASGPVLLCYLLTFVKTQDFDFDSPRTADSSLPSLAKREKICAISAILALYALYAQLYINAAYFDDL